MPWVIRLLIGVVQARLPDRAPPRRSAAQARPTRRGRGRTHSGRCRGTQPAPASAQQNAREQPGCGAAAGGPSPCGRGDPRPPGGGEGGQVGYLQAAGRELVGEPPRDSGGWSCGRLGTPRCAAAPRRSPAAGPSPGRFPAAARAARRSGSPRRLSSVSGGAGARGRRDERRGQGPGHCLQQLGRDRRARVVVGVYRVRLHGGFLSQGPCPLGDLGGWSRGPYCARICPGKGWWSRCAMVRRSAWEHRARRRGRTLPSRHIAADLRAPHPRRPRGPGAALAPHPALAQLVRSQPGHAGPARLGRPAGRRVGGCGAQSWYIKVRSVVYDRAGSVGTQQVAVADRRSRRPTSAERSGPAVHVPCEHGEQAGGDEVADRVVLGDPAQLTIAEPETRGTRR